eukprot:gnl/MRDRNA2_/MRDRNA2_76954_c0_seq1.p1 gnl/MRDRNA2_/MRDRNA2_76954_c0~~gnl/MRDRNA2_/MRDRNA2_76954_c0_seq1.p1  ORF type:complete len:596 (-),score=109.31 gnl/MRDRNA2_/MRDRNA2_76954_c0_seq1:565-2262(-)
MANAIAKLLNQSREDNRQGANAPKQGSKSLGKLIQSPKFNIIVFSAIFANAIQMGVQQDWYGPAYITFYMVLDSVFTLVFAIEMILKLAFLRCSYFKDMWNLLDFLTTWVGIVDLCILTPMYGASGLKVLTAVRILRVFRILRVARVLRRFKELWLILHGIVQSVKTIAWVSMLLLVFLYISAILCAIMIGKSQDYPGYDEGPVEDWPSVKDFNVYQRFGTMLRSMFTLFQMAILTDDWDIVCRALLECQPSMLIVVYLFYVFCSFGLLNVIAGVVCDSVVSNNMSMQKDLDQAELQKISKALDVFQKTVFADNVDFIGRQEICEAWNLGKFEEPLKELHLPDHCGPEEFFDLLDTGGANQISKEEFKKGFLRLMNRSSIAEVLLENKAGQVRILKQLNPQDNSGGSELANQLHDLHTELSLLRSELNALKIFDEENQPSASPYRSSPTHMSEATNKSEPFAEPFAEPQPEAPFAAVLGLCPEPDNRFPRGLTDGPVPPQMATWIQNEVSAFLDVHLDLAVRCIAQECAVRIKATQREHVALGMSTPRFLEKIDAARDEGRSPSK